MATSSDESEEVNRHAAQNKIKQKQRTPTHSAAFVVIQCPDIVLSQLPGTWRLHN